MADAKGVLIVAQTAGEDLSVTARNCWRRGEGWPMPWERNCPWVGVLGESVERAAQQAIQAAPTACTP